jgi:Uma2 family endonuclease
MRRDLQPIKSGVNFEAFLEFQGAEGARYELVDGLIFEMNGETTRHNRIVGRVYARILLRVDGTDCNVFMNGVLVRLPSEIGYAPDVFVSCEEEESDRYQRRPCLIVEVLSPSTATIDKTEKWENYRKIPELQTYILLSQDEPRAEVYQRTTEGDWRFTDVDVRGNLRMPCVNLELPLEPIYAGLIESDRP